MIVHVLGNSHVGYFVGRKPVDDGVAEYGDDDLLIRAYKAGSTGATVRGLDNPDSATGAGEKFRKYMEDNVPVENLVVVIGDVDARYHAEAIGVHSQMKEVVSKLEAYIGALPGIDLVRRLVLFGMVPFSVRSMIDLDQDSMSHAQLALNMLSRELCLLCKRRYDVGWRYLSVFQEIVGPDGFLVDRFVETHDYSHCHYANTQAIILPKLVELLR